MKLSEAIEKQYRGNLMFHTQDWPWYNMSDADGVAAIEANADVERAFDATFSLPAEPECLYGCSEFADRDSVCGPCARARLGCD